MPIRNGPLTAHGRGRVLPPDVPFTWMANSVINQWVQLPNSTVSAPNPDSYSGMATDTSGNLWLIASGGHSNGIDNGASKYNFGVNSPIGWEQVRAGTVNPTPLDQAYYSDGRPAARHTYESLIYDPDSNHMMMMTCYAPGTSSVGFNSIDGFNIATGDWEPAGTYPYNNGAGSLGTNGYNGGVVRDPRTGNLFWAAGGTTWMWKPGQSTLTDKGLTVDQGRFPNCWDSSRNAIFGLHWGNGQQEETGVRTYHTVEPGSVNPVKRTITFASSAAYTAFQNATPSYGAMDYDPIADKYLFVHGANTTPSLYEIIPNSGTVWDMDFPTESGSKGTAVSSGMVGKLKYISHAGIGGFLMYSNALYFRRTI